MFTKKVFKGVCYIIIACTCIANASHPLQDYKFNIRRSGSNVLSVQLPDRTCNISEILFAQFILFPGKSRFISGADNQEFSQILQSVGQRQLKRRMLEYLLHEEEEEEEATSASSDRDEIIAPIVEVTPMAKIKGMIDKLDNTIEIVKDPTTQLQLLDSLPSETKSMLYEVSALLIRNGKDSYKELLARTQAPRPEYTLSASMKGIGYAYQTGTDYETFLDEDHIIFLTTTWLAGFAMEQNGMEPIVASDSVIAIMPYIIEAAETARKTEMQGLLEQLDTKICAQ